MRHVAFRVFLITIIWIFLCLYVFPWNSYGINMPFVGTKEYKLGLDLQWWIELDYKVDLEELRKNENFDKNEEKAVIEWLKAIVDKRVEALNINDSELNDASYGWESHIIVQIPLKGNDSMENLENIEKAKEAIWKVVKIQFKEKRTEVTQADLQEREDIAKSIFWELEAWEKFGVVASKYSLSYEKVLEWSIASLSELVKDVSDISADKVNKVELNIGDKWYLIINENTPNNFIAYIYVSETPSEWKPAMDSKGRILDDRYFIKSSVVHNEAYQPLVELSFNTEWGEIFWELTKRLVGQQIAIFVWGEILTAPNVNEPIYWWKAVITWQESTEAAKLLSQNINTWVVPAPIYLTSEKTIDSKIWASALENLVIAWIVGFALLFVFLVIVYRVSWLMASIALFLYTVLILAVVKIFGVVLTMASIAWLILSIWMAIDANILIFERVKEKLDDGEALLFAIESWFKESFTAIWDSNLTSLLTAIVLYIFWINMIKWFWLMLGIWIILSLFTVMFVSKVFIIWMWLLIKDKNLFIWYKK